MALELAPYRVRVNAVCPGLIDTERNEFLKNDDRWDRQVRSIPLGYAGASDDIAEAIRFLCSPGAAFITGEFINVNGGAVMQYRRSGSLKATGFTAAAMLRCARASPRKAYGNESTNWHGPNSPPARQ